MKVTMIMAMTADGFIARNGDQMTQWTDQADREFFSSVTSDIGTVIMGSNTYRTLREPLEGRLSIVMSTAGDLADPIPGVLEFFSGEPKDLLDSLEARGIEHVAMIGGSQLAASFLFDRLVEEIFLTVEPRLFGQGVPLLTGPELEATLELIDTKRIGENSVILQYRVNYER